jgi:hypothetical protein
MKIIEGIVRRYTAYSKLGYASSEIAITSPTEAKVNDLVIGVRPETKTTEIGKLTHIDNEHFLIIPQGGKKKGEGFWADKSTVEKVIVSDSENQIPLDVKDKINARMAKWCEGNKIKFKIK